MKKAWLKLAFGFMACFFLVGYGASFAQTETEEAAATAEAAEQPKVEASPEPAAGELPPPLESEMTVADHWSKNPYPKTVPAGSRVHVVEKGDTLWDLAQRYFNNPFLWPQIWEANNYIPNAHWIYPGDPVVIPPLTPISEEKIAKEIATQPGGIPSEEVPAGGPTGPYIPSPQKKNYPIALDFDLYCSGFIIDDTSGWNFRIIGNEENVLRVAQSLYDVVYINQGEADGITPGDEFTVIHKARSVGHPVSLRPMGTYVIQTGRLKVVATQEHTSTAQITYSCDASLVGDYLIPFEPKEVPLLSEMPPVDRYSAEGGNLKGYIIFSKDDLGSVGVGHEIQVDVGLKDGINVGTRLILYRPQSKGYEGTGFEKDLPRRVLGEVVVFSVRDTTSTGRIIQMYDFVQVGDRVEVR